MKQQIKLPSLIAFLLLIFVASFVNFYATNLVMSDVSNMFYGAHDFYFVASIPGFIFALLFLIFVLFILRFYLHPKSRKNMTLIWIKVAIGFGIVGLIASILTGTVIYHSFLKPYPFPGYSIISLVFYTLFITGMFYLIFYIKKNWPEDEVKRKITLRSSWHTTWLSLLMFFSFNRFGALLWAPSFIHLRTLYMTWPYYIWLALPMILLIMIASDIFGIHEVGTKRGIITHLVLLNVDIIFILTVILIGINNTQFISAVSPTVAIERLATLPIDTVVEFILLISFELYFLIREVKKYLKKNK